MLNLFTKIDQKGTSLRVLEPEISTGEPMGRTVSDCSGMVAEMELGFIKERQRAGIVQQRPKGSIGAPGFLRLPKDFGDAQAGCGGDRRLRELSLARRG